MATSISAARNNQAPADVITLMRPRFSPDLGISSQPLEEKLAEMVEARVRDCTPSDRPIAALYRVRRQCLHVEFLVLVDLVERVSYVVGVNADPLEPYLRVPTDSPIEAARVARAHDMDPDDTSGDLL